MKKNKTIYKIFFMLFLIVACSDNLRDISFADNIALPTNVAAIYNITQDNTGLVTITPNADGAQSFSIYFGDSTAEPAIINQGESANHVYAEGTYEVKVVASNLNGETTEVIQQLIVSFKAPKNLVVVLENDSAISKKVNITANADFATFFEFDSGETAVTQPVVTGNIGTTISYQYQDAGTYSLKVIAKGGAIETTEYVMDFEVTEILAPINSAPVQPGRKDADVISIFSNAYTDVAGSDFYPNWGQATQYTPFDLNGDAIIQYSNLNYQGINIGSTQDLSSMEFLRLDIWTADAINIDTYLISAGSGEKFIKTALKKDKWTSIEIPLSAFTDQGLSVADIYQFKFVGSGTVFIDNIYFYKAPTPTGSAILSDDFEGNGNITSWAGDSCGMNNDFANPYKDALNGSDTVLEYSDTGGQYANIRFDKGSSFDLTGGNSIFTLKIYVPSSSVSGSQSNQISLKLQDGTAGQPWAQQTEIIKAIALDTWQTVSFDFATDVTGGAANPISRTDFNRVVLQVNSENNSDTVIAYIDDFTYGAQVVDTEPIVNDDFEGSGTITTWAGDACGMDNAFVNPFKDALNSSDTVLEYNDTGGQYANVRFDITPNYDLNAKSKFSLKIYVPSSSVSGSLNNQISLKLQDSDANPWERQSVIIKDIALNTWQDVTFDFATDTVLGVTDALSITNFSRIVIQVNGENNNETVIAYIDDFKYFK
ncbi:MAG: hypothetical protein ACI93P_001633 [bacterium]|jgi:hypothetical protein